MKEETKRKLIKYGRVILPILILVILGSYKLYTMKVQNVPDRMDVGDKKVTQAFQEAKKEHNMLTLTGTSDKADYEWFYAENMVTGSKKTDLNITFTSDYDDYVRKQTGATEVLGYYFKENVKLNGHPQLTLKLKNWKNKDIKLYQIWNNHLVYVMDPIVNDNDGKIEVTYEVQETKGIFYLAAGVHNTKLQGGQTVKQQNGTRKVSDEKTKKDSGKSENNRAGTNHENNNSSVKNPSGSNHSNSGGGSTGKNHSGNSSHSNSSSGSGSGGKYINDKKPSTESESLMYASAALRKISDGTQTGQDQYLTDPVPAGKPLPVEPGSAKINYNKPHTCTLSIDCKTILDNKKDLEKEKESYVPKDGWIMKKRTVIFYEGESVFDVLLRETKKESIQMEYSMTPIYNSNYIEGIHNLYEFDCGRYSGWMYKVNDWYPNYGCSRYMLEDGDEICWRYTCDLGKDVGCEWIGGTK